MPVPALLAVAALGMTMNDSLAQFAASRFQLRQPVPGVAAALLDTRGYGANLANQLATERGLQGRVMWIDATANIDRYNTEAKIDALADTLAAAGFNTVVLDVKPISGHVLYPSKFAPKLTEWKGKQLPADFDPVKAFVSASKRTDLSLLVSLNAFSEGHSLMNTGPGYEHTEWQSVLYEPGPVLQLGAARIPFAEAANAPLGDGSHAVFANRLGPETLVPGVVIATVDWPRGAIVSVTDGNVSDIEPKIPNRGYALVGTGAAGEFLRANAVPGVKVVLDTDAEFHRIGSLPDQQVPLMVNPNHPEVRSRAIEILAEVARNYAVDGILYDDRFRYAGLNADFSPRSQALFERHVGKALQWPDDVFKFTVTPTFGRGVAPGPYYDAWMAWRSSQLKEYFADAKAAVYRERPDALFGLYVGSWYGEYPAYGVNVADHEMEAGFWFMTPEYKMTGLGSLLDLVMVGAYYPTPTMADGMANGAGIGNTIEGAGQLATRVVRDRCWTYAGLMLSQFKDDPERLGKALQAACGSTQGIMVFDLSHDSDTMMPTFAAAFSDRRSAPHADRKALAELRKRRNAFDKSGKREEPVTIGLGSAGTGF